MSSEDEIMADAEMVSAPEDYVVEKSPTDQPDLRQEATDVAGTLEEPPAVSTEKLTEGPTILVDDSKDVATELSGMLPQSLDEIEGLSRENCGLKEQINQLTRLVAELTQKPSSGRHSGMASKAAQVATLERNLTQLSQNYGGLQAQCQKLYDQNVNLKKRDPEYIREIEHLKQMVEKQRIQCVELRDSNRSLQGQLASQEDTVTKAQQAALAFLTTEVSQPISDDVVREKFRTLFNDVTYWCRQHCVDSLEQHSPDLETFLTEAGLLNHSMNATYRLKFDIRSAPGMILNAALSHELCQALLLNPFFFLGERTSEGAFTPFNNDKEIDQGDRLVEIHNDLLDRNKMAAYEWRAQTVQLLNSNPGSMTPMKKHIYDFITNNFIKHYAVLIADDVKAGDESVKGLHAIVHEFGEFSIRLWSQRPYIQCYALAHFSKTVFKNSSYDMEAARTVLLEEGDTRLDDRPIPLVLQPLIVAFGGNQLEGSKKGKIWSKAVVWVSSQPAPMAQRVLGAMGNFISQK